MFILIFVLSLVWLFYSLVTFIAEIVLNGLGWLVKEDD